jgi:large subunit ribosomal protein L4
MYKKAMKCIFSELVNKKRLVIVDDFFVESPKTKDMVLKLQYINMFSGLLISDNIDKNLFLSSKNIPNFFVKTVGNINPLILIKNKNIIITVNALKKLEGLLK